MVNAVPMPPTDGEVLEYLSAVIAEANGDPVHAVIEQVSGYIGEKQPAYSAFTFGYRHGFLIGVLQGTGKVRIELVQPQKWQKIFSLGNKGTVKVPVGASDEERQNIQRINARLKTMWKNKLKETAQRLYPELKVTLAICDSLLILEYGRRAYGFYDANS